MCASFFVIVVEQKHKPGKKTKIEMNMEKSKTICVRIPI
jgi:predicted protein tyrosine phosphatase